MERVLCWCLLDSFSLGICQCDVSVMHVPYREVSWLSKFVCVALCLLTPSVRLWWRYQALFLCVVDVYIYIYIHIYITMFTCFNNPFDFLTCGSLSCVSKPVTWFYSNRGYSKRGYSLYFMFLFLWVVVAKFWRSSCSICSCVISFTSMRTKSWKTHACVVRTYCFGRFLLACCRLSRVLMYFSYIHILSCIFFITRTSGGHCVMTGSVYLCFFVWCVHLFLCLRTTKFLVWYSNCPSIYKYLHIQIPVCVCVLLARMYVCARWYIVLQSRCLSHTWILSLWFLHVMCIMELESHMQSCTRTQLHDSVYICSVLLVEHALSWCTNNVLE